MDAGKVKIVDAVTLRAIAVVRENLHRLREHAGNPTLQELATKAGVGYGTLHRLFTGTAGPSGKNPPPNLDTLARVADHFGLAPWQLQVPGLDPRRPPVLVAAPTTTAAPHKQRSKHEA